MQISIILCIVSILGAASLVGGTRVGALFYILKPQHRPSLSSLQPLLFNSGREFYTFPPPSVDETTHIKPVPPLHHIFHSPGHNLFSPLHLRSHQFAKLWDKILHPWTCVTTKGSHQVIHLHPLILAGLLLQSIHMAVYCQTPCCIVAAKLYSFSIFTHTAIQIICCPELVS